MPARKHRSLVPAAPSRSARILRRVTRGALLAVSLKAAQLAGDVTNDQRLFDRGLVDKLRAPLTRYHE